jgi:hypothetical protein
MAATCGHEALKIAEAGMPFPFLPGGALLAIAVLGGALTVFGLALRAMDRTIAAGRRTILPGLVSGFRTWVGASPSAPVADPEVAAAAPLGTELIEIDNRRIPDDDRPV